MQNSKTRQYDRGRKEKLGRFHAALLIPALIAAGLVGCGGPERTAAKLPEQRAIGGWDAYLKAGGPRMELHTLNTGTVTVPLSGMLNLEHPRMKGTGDRRLVVQVMAHLLRHPTRGDFLIDSGYDASFAPGRKPNMGGPMLNRFVLAWSQQPGRDIAAQLRDHRSNLKGVFFTHLHSDHTSGVPGLPAGVPLFAGKGDRLLNIPLIYHNSHFARSETIRELDCAAAIRTPILGPVLDLLGDGSLYAICTPGHSRAHLSFLARTRAGPVLLTGDASHTRRGFDQGVEPGWAEDHDLARESLNRLRAFAQRYTQVRVIYGHEL